MEFKQIYDEYSRMLLHFAIKILKDETIAEDAVQDAFMRLWQNQNFKNPKAFLALAVRHYCLKYLKNKEQTNNLSIEVEEEMDNEEMKTELLDLIYKAANKLKSKTQKEIFYLHYIYGYDYNKISEITKINTKSVKNRLGEARESIRKRVNIWHRLNSC